MIYQYNYFLPKWLLFFYLVPKLLLLFIWCRNGNFYLFGAETVTMGAETVRSSKSDLTWGSRNGKNDEQPKKMPKWVTTAVVD